jgi:hypothetical protein
MCAPYLSVAVCTGPKESQQQCKRVSPVRLSDTINAGTVDKCSKDELATLVLRSCYMYSNGKGGRAQRMHHMETLLRYLRMCTPKVLIVLASGLVGITPE